MEVQVTITQLPFICFDIETTGLNPIENKILEIAAVHFSVDQGIINQFSTLVHTESIIPKESTAIHGITNSMLENAPKLDSVLKQFIDFIGKNPLLAHNASFDTSFIGYQLGRHQLPYPENDIYDTLIFSRKLYPNLRSHSLSNLKKFLSIEGNPSHRALEDSQTTMNLFHTLIEKWTRNRTQTIQNLNQLVKPISFSTYEIENFNICSAFIEQINRAIEMNKKVIIVYSDKQQRTTERKINPLDFFLTNGFIYIEGFCHLRKDKRRFRIDRIQELHIQSETIN